MRLPTTRSLTTAETSGVRRALPRVLVRAVFCFFAIALSPPTVSSEAAVFCRTVIARQSGERAGDLLLDRRQLAERPLGPQPRSQSPGLRSTHAILRW